MNSDNAVKLKEGIGGVTMSLIKVSPGFPAAQKRPDPLWEKLWKEHRPGMECQRSPSSYALYSLSGNQSRISSKYKDQSEAGWEKPYESQLLEQRSSAYVLPGFMVPQLSTWEVYLHAFILSFWNVYWNSLYHCTGLFTCTHASNVCFHTLSASTLWNCALL